MTEIYQNLDDSETYVQLSANYELKEENVLKKPKQKEFKKQSIALTVIIIVFIVIVLVITIVVLVAYFSNKSNNPLSNNQSSQS